MWGQPPSAVRRAQRTVAPSTTLILRPECRSSEVARVNQVVTVCAEQAFNWTAVEVRTHGILNRNPGTNVGPVECQLENTRTDWLAGPIMQAHKDIA